MKRRLRAPSPALVISLLALFIALGGTSYAAIALPKNSVGTKQLKKNAVTGPKIKNGAVTKTKINTSGLTVPNATNATNATTATNALNLGGVPASKYIQGPVEAVHAVGTTGNPAFGTNWANLGGGFQTTDFYKDPLGIVHLEGDLQHTGNGNGETVFTLPAGYQPSMIERFVVQGNGDSNSATLEVGTDGRVAMWGVTATGSNYTLNGVTFRP
jgi:hypothetical protein